MAERVELEPDGKPFIVVVGALKQRDMRVVAGREHGGRLERQRRAADDRRPAARHAAGGRQQRRDRLAAQAGGRGRGIRAAELRRERSVLPFRLLLVLALAASSALRDRVLEQAGRRWGGHVVAHARTAGRLPEDRHIARVAAERLRVAPHPAQRRLLVHQPVVAAGVAGPSAASEGSARKPNGPSR